MTYRNPYGSVLFQMSALLSQRVSEADDFFKDIAMMSLNERKAYAVLKVIQEKELLEKDIEKMTVKELVEEIIMPLIQRMGQANFKADVLTHLGMKIGRSLTEAEMEEI